MIDQLPNTVFDKEILKEGGVGELRYQYKVTIEIPRLDKSGLI